MRGRQPACKRREPETRVKHQQRPLAVKAIEHEAAGETEDRSRQSVGGDEVGELGGRDVKHVHQLRAQRHHDHEIQHMGELYRPEGEERGAFAARCEGVVLVGSGHEGRSVGVFRESATVRWWRPPAQRVANVRGAVRGTVPPRGSGSAASAE